MINYTDAETPYTRIIEHKHFEFGSTEPGTKTVISREYSAEWQPGDEPYYPVNDERTWPFTPGIRRWPMRNRMLFSADGWVNTGIMIWTR